MKVDLDLGDTRLIIKACEKEGVSLQKAAYILATTYHETAATMKPVREAFWLSEGWRRRNLRYYPYYGRGYCQLTWKYNYEKGSKVTGVNLVDKPDLAMETKYAIKILITGMLEGWYTTKALGQYVNDQKKDYVNARKVVNGLDDARLIASYALRYERALRPIYNPRKRWNWLRWFRL